MYMYLSVVLMLHNKAFLTVGSALHVAAYGVVTYAESFFYLVFEGIALVFNLSLALTMAQANNSEYCKLVI